MKKLCYLFTVLLAVTFAACDNGGPEGPANPNQPSNPSKPENTANGHEYVDLGLSVKWATCNVGANTSEEYGDYFAWGETQAKEVYAGGNYKWYKFDNNGNYTKTKYNNNSDEGIVDNKTVLDLEDDAAHVNWGGAWRMPTMEEQQELVDNCTFTWTIQNGVNGCIVTSKKNGNSIFLPAASMFGESFWDSYDAEFGKYWSSTLHYDYNNGISLTFWYYEHSNPYIDGYDHTNYVFYGHSIRPVLP